ncbi:MAG: immunoglobulin domain-containing protein, partial [Bacteroidota bacterium]|nr:immunoglobulin domain-containing protein [Bacteroidota bacterium]
GTGTLTYSIDGGATYNSNNVFSSLKAGSYSIFVKDANGCTATATANVTEPAVLAASITPKDQQICSGSGAISMKGNPAGGNGGYTHLWTGTGASLLSGTTVENPSFDDKTPGSYTLTYKVTDSKGCTASDNTTVTVNAAISITTQPSPQTVCAGSTVNFPVAASGGGTLSYQWQKDGTNLTDGGSISNSKTATLAVSNVSSADAGKYTCVVSTTTTCPSVTSSQAQLTVNPATAITTQPGSQTVCVGSTVTFNVVAAGTAPITYQWKKGGSDVTDGGNISGSKTSTLTITNADNTYAGDYTCIVHSSCGGDVTTNKATLAFNPVTTINSQPASQTVCAGSTVSFSVTATGAGTLTYQWQKGGSNISGATGSTLTLTNVASSDGGSYVCIVNSGTCPKAVNSAAAVLTVNSLPTVSFSGVTSPYCQNASPVTLTGSPLGGTFSGSAVTDIGGGTASFFPTSAGTYTITYTYTDANTCSNSSKKDIVVNALPTVTFTGTLASQCEGSTVYQLTGGSPAGGSYSGPGVSGTNFNATAAGVGTHTITYSYTDAKGCSASATNSIAVNAKTVITTQPLDLTVCSGSTVGFTVTATGSGTLTYQWKKDGINLTDGGNISGSTTSTLTDSNVVTSDAGNYTCTVTGTCSSATSNPAKLSVNAATLINTQPVSQTICSGSNVSFSVAATGTTPLTYQWQKDGANLSDGGNISGSSTSALQINNADNTNAGAYRCVVHSACGTDVTSNAANLTFYSLTTITQQPSDVISCSGNTVSFLITATAEGSPTYQWYKGATKLTDGGNIIGSTSSNLNITNISKSDEGNYYCAVASSICPSPLNSSNAKLTVNIIPTVSFSGVTSPYCQSLSAATLTGNHPGGSFTGTDVSDNGDGTASFFPTSAGTYTINYFYTDGDGCSNSAQQNILVNAFPTVAFDGTLATQCAGATSYQLTGGSPEGGIYAGSGVTGSNFDAVTAGTGRHTLTYTYTDANGCSASATNGIEVSTAIQAMVDPSSILTLGCNGISDGAIDVTVTGGNEPYTFSWTGPDGFAQSTQNIANLKAGTYNLSVTDANGCVQDFPALATISQPVLLKETVAQTRITCYSAADGKIQIHAS